MLIVVSVKTIREFYKKEFEPSDVRTGIICALSIRIQEPVFESQTKTKLGSTHMEPNGEGQSIRNYIGDIVKRNLDSGNPNIDTVAIPS